MSRRLEKLDFYLANEGYGLACFSTEMGHIFESNNGNEFVVTLKGRGPHKAEFGYDIVRIQSLKVYTDLVALNTVGQKFSKLQIKPLLKNCFHSFHISLRDTSGEKQTPCISWYELSCFYV